MKTSKFAAPEIILPTDDGSLIFCENSRITIRRSNVNGAPNYELRVWDVTRGDNNPAINKQLGKYETSYTMAILGGHSYKIEMNVIDNDKVKGQIATSIIEPGKLVTRDLKYGIVGSVDVLRLHQKLDYIFEGTGIPNFTQEYGESFSNDTTSAINRVLGFGGGFYPPPKLRNRYLGSYHC